MRDACRYSGRMRSDTLVEKLASLSEHLHIGIPYALAIHGSYIRGDATAYSDLDLLLLCGRDGTSYAAALENFFSAALSIPTCVTWCPVIPSASAAHPPLCLALCLPPWQFLGPGSPLLEELRGHGWDSAIQLGTIARQVCLDHLRTNPLLNPCNGRTWSLKRGPGGFLDTEVGLLVEDCCFGTANNQSFPAGFSPTISCRHRDYLRTLKYALTSAFRAPIDILDWSTFSAPAATLALPWFLQEDVALRVTATYRKWLCSVVPEVNPEFSAELDTYLRGMNDAK